MKSAANVILACIRDSAPLCLQSGKAATEEKNNFDWQSSSAGKNGTTRVANINRAHKQEHMNNPHASSWILSIYTTVSFPELVRDTLLAQHYFRHLQRPTDRHFSPKSSDDVILTSSFLLIPHPPLHPNTGILSYPCLIATAIYNK